jgi:hypothetical protein
MAKATIKTKAGATIVVEGSHEEVAKILGDFERKTVIEKTKVTQSKQQKEKKEEKKRMSATDLIIELREDGFFNKPKTLADVAQALENRGYLYPTTTLSAIVLGLVQKKLLGRKKADGKWVYGK